MLAGMETDPVCGMEVDREHAVAAWEHDGVTYRFCSVRCMERFRAEPERYLAPSRPREHAYQH